MIRDVTLTVEQYDICWADLNLGEHVYPLQILGHGRTYDERAQLRRRGSSLLLALIDQLPTAAAASGQSITLPRDVLVPAQQETVSIYDASPSTSERFRHQFRALETVLARPRLRGGQITANTRNRIGKRYRSRPVEWFDTEAGRWTARLLPTTDGGQHLTVAAADNARMATQIAETIDRMMR